MSLDLERKIESLRSYFRKLGGVIIAFSGGVDSSVLAKTAYDSLDHKAIAVTIVSPATDPTELECAENIAKEIGISHILVGHDELENEGFRENTKERCYYCKKEMIKKLLEVGRKQGIKEIAEGTNAADLKGHRPGYRALLENGIRSPFAELGITKEDIRKIASLYGLPNSEKPSAACLASRIPYGTKITKELLGRVSRSESLIRSFGVKQIRVRCFDDLAVIEVLPEDYGKVLKNGKEIAKGLKKAGFDRVTLDLEGYSTGRMNE